MFIIIIIIIIIGCIKRNHPNVCLSCPACLAWMPDLVLPARLRNISN